MEIKQFYKQANGFEICYNVLVSASIPEEKINILRLILAKGMDRDTVKFESQFQDAGSIVEIGPQMNFETPESSNIVTICHACFLPEVLRVEESRRYRLGENEDRKAFIEKNCDRMTEAVYPTPIQSFDSGIVPEATYKFDMMGMGTKALQAEYNPKAKGLPFDEHDRQRYYDYFVGKYKRNPTSVEIFDLANADSDHSRHHAFSGKIKINGEEMPETMFEVVKSIHRVNPHNSKIAFKDNASAIAGGKCFDLQALNPGKAGAFYVVEMDYNPLLTAETHNFPSGVAPYPGAETGLGGLIRDAYCAGQGSRMLSAGAGYCVGKLDISGYVFPWEECFADFSYPPNLATPQKIAIKASDGVSDYGNCFGVPTTLGFFRSFASVLPDGRRQEFIKPIVYVAGAGMIGEEHIEKGKAEKGLLIVRIGGPAYNVGFGGGAASSVHQGENEAKLDFDAVQRGNPEMERKAVEVTMACNAMGKNTPIVSTHDQGAGGPGNVLKEIVEEAGGRVYISRIKRGDPTLSTLQVWVAEYQEGFAFLIDPTRIAEFEAICVRENVSCEILGEVTGDGKFVVEEDDGTTPVNIDLSFVSAEVPQKTFSDIRVASRLKPLELPEGMDVERALNWVLREPSVACKNWLTDKVDRHVLGRSVLQQCVGPLQLALADCSITAFSHFDKNGYVKALGEQPYKLLLDPEAGARMAVAEMLTNMCWGVISDRRNIKCSANWMWAPKVEGERAAMYDALLAMREIMVGLGIAPDGGKDSLSMATKVGDEIVTSLRQLVIAGYAYSPDVSKFVTPDIKAPEDSFLVWVDLSGGHARLGGSTLAHVCGGQIGDKSPDVDAKALAKAFDLTQKFIKEEKILSGHDISDGGLIVALLEMAFAGNCGLEIVIDSKHKAIDQLFAEEAGLIYEVSDRYINEVMDNLLDKGLTAQIVGYPVFESIDVRYNDRLILEDSLKNLRAKWLETSCQLEKLQSNPKTAEEKYFNINHYGWEPQNHVSFEPKPTPPIILRKNYPTMILRDEGTNGHDEMKSAAWEAGLDPHDVHMTDWINGKVNPKDFLFMVVPGGFSHMDVIESAKGFAVKTMLNERVWEEQQRFNARPETLSLGVCNGCQRNILLGIVPGYDLAVEDMPRMETNLSDKFESLWVHLLIPKSPSILMKDMEGSVLGAWVAHKQGRFHFPNEEVLSWVIEDELVTMRYVDPEGHSTKSYPWNPNGSADAIAGLTTRDGRHTVCMPHPIDRGFKMWQWAYVPESLKHLKVSPWLKMFQNARQYFDKY